jgi:hypothetical protein
MKKTSIILATLLLISGALSAAPKKAAAPVEIKPITVKLTEANLAENQGTMQNQVFNADGSVTYDAMMRYGGGGISFFINGPKEGINLKNYSTVHVVFDYKTVDGWKNSAKAPKFKIVTWGPGTTYYNGGVDRCYFDADELSGTYEYDLDVSAMSGKIIKIAVPLNAWKWVEDGGSDEDLVKMTIKEITFLP